MNKLWKKKRNWVITVVCMLLLSTLINTTGSGSPVNAEVSEATSAFDWNLVDQLRSEFFEGPILDYIDLDLLDPSKISDQAEFGAIAQFQYKNKPGFEHVVPEKILPFAAAAGIKWLRTGYGYRWVSNEDPYNPEPMPREEFTAPGYMDKWINMEYELGFKPSITLGTGRTSLQKYKDDMDAYNNEYGRYAQYLIERYGDKIGAMELSNEPYHDWVNVFGGDRFSGGLWVKKYADFVASVSADIKDAAPNIPVINGMSDFSPAIEQLKYNPDTQIDVMNYHHYPQRLSPEYAPFGHFPRNGEFVSSGIFLEDVASDYMNQSKAISGNEDLQMWITETGVHTKAETYIHQAKDALRVYTVGLGSEDIDKTFYFNIIDGQDLNKRPHNYGLVTSDYQPKPSYFAVARLSALTQGGTAKPDANFQAIITNIKVSDSSALPLWSDDVKKAGIMHHVKENIEIKKLNLESGGSLIAVWSTAHTDRGVDEFVPRRIEFTVNQSLGEHPIYVDPLSGKSEALHERKAAGDSNYESFTMDVEDYPKFIYIPN